MITRGEKKEQEQMKNSNKHKNLENSSQNTHQERIYLHILKIAHLEQKGRNVDRANK